MEMSTIIADVIAESYRRSPKLTLFTIFFTIILTITASVALKYYQDEELKRRAPESLTSQLEELDKFDNGLKNLSAFIQLQKKKLTEKDTLIAELEKKQSELEPIVKSQDEVVDAIFKIQEQRSQRNKWKDLGIGFVLGILGSLIASVIFKLVDRRQKRA